MIITQRETPKTANLLACKQWWKVCFLHGNQEKYYRQIYSRAAAQRRLANYGIDDDDKDKSRVDFPTKLIHENDTFKIKENVAINMHDDPFLFGINGVDAENANDT